MKGSSDAIKSALKRLGNDNRPSSSQGPNEQAPARGGGPPGSSQLPRSTEQPAEAEPSTTVPLEKRQPSERCAHRGRPRSYHQVADHLEPWRLHGQTGTGCQNSRETLPPLTGATEERCSAGPLRGVARIDSKSANVGRLRERPSSRGPQAPVRTGSRSRVP
jgi:hypothetical protein